MAANDTVTLRARARDDGATATINKVRASLLDVGKAAVVFESVRRGMDLAIAGARQLAEFMGDSVKEAAAAQAVQNKLELALRNTGQATDATRESLKAYADTMQAATTYEDDRVTGLLASAVAMGNTAERAKRLTSVAINLSEAIGIDADVALKGLTQTTQGATATLGRYIPELQGLSKEQLIAGKGVELLEQRFRGFAETAANTVQGRVEQAKNAFANMQEALGNVIIKSPAVKTALVGLADVFRKLEGFVKDNQAVLGVFVTNGLASAVTGFGYLVSTIGDVMVRWKDLQTLVVAGALTWTQAMRAIEFTDKGKATLDARIASLTKMGVELAGDADKSRELNEKIQKTALDIGALGERMRVSGAQGVEAMDTVASGVQSVQSAVEAAEDKWLSFDEIMYSSMTDDEMFDTFQRKFAEATAGNMKEVEVKAGPADTAKSDWKQATLEGIQSALGSGTIGGLISSVGGTIGQALGKPVIAAVAGIGGTLLDALSNFTPKAADAFFKGLTESLMRAFANIGPAIAVLADNMDEIISAVAAAIPLAISGIVANLPSIIASVLPQVAGYLIAGLPGLIVMSIIQAWPQVKAAFLELGRTTRDTFRQTIGDMGGKFEQLGQHLNAVFDVPWIKGKLDQLGEHITGWFGSSVDKATANFNNWLEKAGDKFSQAGKWVVNGLITFLNHLIDAINWIPFLNDIDHIQKFAQGGIVAGMSGQAVPVVAHAGEVVLNQRQQNRLMELIERGGGGGGVNVTINEARSPGETVDALVLALRAGVRQGRISSSVLLGTA